MTTGLSDGALLWQVACEFVAASRKLAPFGFNQAQAWHEVERLRALWKLILPSEKVLTRAEQLAGTHNVSFWDAMIVAAAASRAFIQKILTIRSGKGRASKS